jgi:hypothetical protein
MRAKLKLYRIEKTIKKISIKDLPAYLLLNEITNTVNLTNEALLLLKVNPEDYKKEGSKRVVAITDANIFNTNKDYKAYPNYPLRVIKIVRNNGTYKN